MDRTRGSVIYIFHLPCLKLEQHMCHKWFVYYSEPLRRLVSILRSIMAIQMKALIDCCRFDINAARERDMQMFEIKQTRHSLSPRELRFQIGTTSQVKWVFFWSQSSPSGLWGPFWVCLTTAMHSVMCVQLTFMTQKCPKKGYNSKDIASLEWGGLAIPCLHHCSYYFCPSGGA